VMARKRKLAERTAITGPTKVRTKYLSLRNQQWAKGEEEDDSEDDEVDESRINDTI